MSLINKVLKEVDRQEREKDAADLSAILNVARTIDEPDDSPRFTSSMGMMFILGGVTVGALASLGWWLYSNQTEKSSPPPQLTTQIVTEPPVTTAAVETTQVTDNQSTPAPTQSVTEQPLTTNNTEQKASQRSNSTLDTPTPVAPLRPQINAKPLQQVQKSETVVASAPIETKNKPSEQIVRQSVPVLTTNTSPDSAYSEAIQLIRENKPKEAEVKLRQILEVDLKNSRARLALASLLIRNKRTTEATDILADGLMLSPDQTSIRIALAQLWSQSGQMNEALSLMDDGAATASKDPAFLLAHAQLLVRARRVAEALPLFKTASTLNPNDASAWVGLGFSQATLGDNANAQVSLRKALTLPSISTAQREVVESKLREITGIGVAR
jgi:Flp pilus assembly protein TadD